MENEHPFYTFFKEKYRSEGLKTYINSNVKVDIFEENKHKVKGLRVTDIEDDNRIVVDALFFNNSDEMLFLLDRIPLIRASYPSNIGLPTLVQTFGQS